MAFLKRTTALYIIAFILSVLLTLLSIHQYPTFNPDGVRYLLAAQAYLQNGLHAAMQIANWPFYSITLAYTAKFTHLSLLQAGYLQNLILFPVTAILFIVIIRQWNTSIAIQWVALLVILLFHELYLYRASLMRDNGYWVFFLLSVFLMLRFVKQPSWLCAWAWAISMTIATLYRIEGAILLLFVPFVVWFLPNLNWREKLYAYIKLNSLTIIYLAIIIAFLIYKPGKANYYLGRIPEVINQLRHGFILSARNFSDEAAALQKYVLNEFSASNAVPMLLTSLVGVYFILVMQTMSLLYFLLAVYGIKKRLLPAFLEKERVLWVYILLNILITAVFYSQNFFLSKRYLLPLSLLLCVFVSFALVDIYQRWRDRPKRMTIYSWLWPVVMLWLASIFIADILPFGTSNTYIYESGVWINTYLPDNATLYTNENRFAIFTGRETGGWQQGQTNLFDWNKIDEKPWRNYDYLVIRVNHDQQSNLKHLMLDVKSPPLKVFENKKGDQVLIFKNRSLLAN